MGKNVFAIRCFTFNINTCSLSKQCFTYEK